MEIRKFITIFVVFLITLSSLPIVLGENDELKNKHTYNAFNSPFGIYIIIGIFEEISIYDMGYCNVYVLNNTNGFILGYMRDTHGDGSVKIAGPLFISLRDITLTFHTFGYWGYIGDNFLFIITSWFSIK